MQGLRRYFARRARREEVDDLVQEVFLRMQVRGESSQVANVERYLFSVAASVLCDRARRSVVRHSADHRTLELPDHPVEDLTPERVLMDREALEIVVAAIEDLSGRTRDVFLLHRFEEMSCNSIAAQLGLSVSAVEKHIMKAVRFLQTRLNAD